MKVSSPKDRQVTRHARSADAGMLWLCLVTCAHRVLTILQVHSRWGGMHLGRYVCVCAGSSHKSQVCTLLAGSGIGKQVQTQKSGLCQPPTSAGSLELACQPAAWCAPASDPAAPGVTRVPNLHAHTGTPIHTHKTTQLSQNTRTLCAGCM
jgi:hypothetical protein